METFDAKKEAVDTAYDYDTGEDKWRLLVSLIMHVDLNLHYRLLYL